MAISPLVKIAVAASAVPTSLAGSSAVVSFMSTASKNTVSETYKQVNSLEDRMTEKVVSLVKTLFTDKVDSLNEEIQKLNEKISEAESTLDTSSKDKTQSLQAEITQLKEKLRVSILDSKNTMDNELSQLKSQVKNSESTFYSKLSDKASNLQSNINNLNQLLTNLVKNKMDDSEWDVKNSLKQLKERMFELEVLKKSISSGKCSVVLQEAFSSHALTDKENIWSLEDFINTQIKDNQDLTDQLKARCYELGGVGGISVGKDKVTNNFIYWSGQDKWLPQ